MDDNKQHHNNSIPNMPMPPNSIGDKDIDSNPSDSNLAAELIREKLRNIYEVGPSAKQEIEEIKVSKENLSKHQKFIYNLQNSGKSMVEIQTKWHEYYVELPDNEKNVVWQEFYSANKKHTSVSKHVQPHYTAAPDNFNSKDTKPKIIAQQFTKEKPDDQRTTADIKHELLSKVQKGNKNKWREKFHSLAFGLTLGSLVIFIFLFSFFNERFIAPFITPSRNVSAQSLIVNPSGQSAGPDPLIIIPKINVEIPVIYTAPTIDENLIENNLQDGVVHYPITAYPGQNGNGAIFGHSSNNILNPGKYKFAFVLLHTLQVGDTFTLDYQGRAFVYEIFQRKIVPPSDVSVLNNIPGHSATFTLITCDPPGTSINRLIVVGDQISPSTSTNTTGPDQNNSNKPTSLPSNSTSLWSRFIHWL